MFFDIIRTRKFWLFGLLTISIFLVIISTMLVWITPWIIVGSSSFSALSMVWFFIGEMMLSLTEPKYLGFKFNEIIYDDGKYLIGTYGGEIIYGFEVEEINFIYNILTGAENMDRHNDKYVFVFFNKLAPKKLKEKALIEKI